MHVHPTMPMHQLILAAAATGTSQALELPPDTLEAPAELEALADPAEDPGIELVVLEESL